MTHNLEVGGGGTPSPVSVCDLLYSLFKLHWHMSKEWAHCHAVSLLLHLSLFGHNIIVTVAEECKMCVWERFSVDLLYFLKAEIAARKSNQSEVSKGRGKMSRGRKWEGGIWSMLPCLIFAEFVCIFLRFSEKCDSNPWGCFDLHTPPQKRFHSTVMNQSTCSPPQKSSSMLSLT